jgi:hypothetical protein
MAFWQRSAFPALLLALAPLAGACAPLEPEVQELTIRAHSLDSSARCKIETETDPDVTLRALGPFPVSDLGAEVLPYRAKPRTLTFPADTRGLEAEATDFERHWHGYSDRRTERGIDVLLWKEATGSDAMDCDLFHDYPAADGGQGVGYSSEAGIVLVAGGDRLGDSLDASAASFVFDVNTGDAARVDDSFRQARAFATVTPFGSGLLLAGGENPLDPVPVPEREARQSAAVFDPNTRSFDRDLIALELARTRHAAVVLESGETLLVGGGRPIVEDQTVITGTVAKLEVVSPETRSSSIDQVDTLSHGRLEPVAIRLDTGNVLVGGGYDSSGSPVSEVEWLSPDASTHVSPGAEPCGVMPDPPCALLEQPRHHRDFVALPGGGALTVGGCAPGEQDEDCERFCGVGFGCPAPEPSATWIAPDGELTEVGFEHPTSSCAGATPFSPEHVRLAPGSDGSPWLFASDEDRDYPCDAVFRFQPWSNIRACPSRENLPSEGSGDLSRCPVFVPVELDVTDWPDMRARLTSLGPDAFVWMTEGEAPFFAGARAGVRGVLSQNETLLLTDPSAPEVPLHLAPDRRPDAGNELPSAIFRYEEGRLILEPATDTAPSVRVFVTDARYDDVTVTLGFSGDGIPLLLLDSAEIGSESCPWPENAVSPLVITRRAESVTMTDADGATSRCETAPRGSIALGFRAGTSATTITSLGVKRD